MVINVNISILPSSNPINKQPVFIFRSRGRYGRSGDQKPFFTVQVAADHKIYQHDSHEIDSKCYDWQHKTKHKGGYEPELADNKCYMNGQYDTVLPGAPELLSAIWPQWLQWEENPRYIPNAAKNEEKIIQQKAYWRRGIGKW